LLVANTVRTEWVFAEVSDDQGVVAVTEITLGHDQPRVVSLLGELW